MVQVQEGDVYPRLSQVAVETGRPLRRGPKTHKRIDQNNFHFATDSKVDIFHVLAALLFCRKIRYTLNIENLIFSIDLHQSN